MITVLLLASYQGISGVGLGLQAGWPTGFNLRVWRGNGFTPQVIGGLNSGRWHAGLDLQKGVYASSGSVCLGALAGLGLSVEQSDQSSHGSGVGAWLALPALSGEMVFTRFPVGIFVGLSPVISLDSQHQWDFQMGFGLRYTVIKEDQEPEKTQTVVKKPKPKPRPNPKPEVDQQAVQTMYLKGLDAYTKQDYKTAIYYWNKVLEMDPDNEKAKQGIKRAKLYLGE